MSLWVDKYRPKEFSKLDYHKEQAASLKRLAQRGDFPHLLVYGPEGAGKRTRVACLLRELYGSGAERVRLEPASCTTAGGKRLEVSVVSSNYHLEVTPSEAGLHDRLLIMELLKGVAQTHQLDAGAGAGAGFKLVVLNEVDELTREAQHALRRTMEKYVATCRLVLVARSAGRVLPAVRSRCLAIRVPAPSRAAVCAVLTAVCRREGLTLPSELAERIAARAGGNLRRALLACEACRVQQCPLAAEQAVPEADWRVWARDTAALALAEQSPRRLGEVRARLYELLAHGVPPHTVLEELARELSANCDLVLKQQVARLAAATQHRLAHANKHIFHLEAFIAQFMMLYRDFMQHSLADAF